MFSKCDSMVQKHFSQGAADIILQVHLQSLWTFKKPDKNIPLRDNKITCWPCQFFFKNAPSMNIYLHISIQKHRSIIRHITGFSGERFL